jgi:hypothetical protein
MANATRAHMMGVSMLYAGVSALRICVRRRFAAFGFAIFFIFVLRLDTM